MNSKRTYSIHRHFGLSLCLLCTLISPLSHGADIASSVSQGETDRLADGGYFELGAGAFSSNKVDVRQTDHQTIEPALLISGVYQYKGLFAEMVHQSQDGINLGYNIWNSAHWSVDILLANIQTTWRRPEGIDPKLLDEAERNVYLLSEESIYVGAGIRATRYWDDHYVFQFRAVSDYFDDQGLQSSARFGKSWQVRNWNFHALGSVTYSSAKLNRALFGVTADEATDLFPQYTPDSSLSYGIELGAAYPITSNVVFRAMYRYNLLPDVITDSPFNQAGYASFLNATISYVF
ncbi:MipA/OmpV family protein [Shewanella intestini]|uniref:MipA/OmpV family protein n=1 Tax=Shewanella intestini TaxID=2017544 RepID=A0ABS5HZF4_9GAMM|nr:MULTISPECIES: MipA/OmpV family protein [Shewanella]MBR9727177.1 MipA/OmpV family protein [Shewanella intestini]MRG35979.1 MipA/OmpV family protein [Shewanella sp. XMDDZSB0408]